MDEAIKKILEIVTDIQDKMATKEDLESARKDLQSQITANTKAIAEMAEQLRSVFGYAKEIYMLMTRMNAVEKQLGIAK